MQKTFEEGISKGFVRGADEIAGNLSFLSNLNGGSGLWKGEQGAARLLQMNAGLEATTALASASDILSFRGAQNVLKQWDAQEDAKARWEAIGDIDPKKDGVEIQRGYDYVDSMIMLERGLTPELFHSQMQMIEGVEGVGNRTSAVEQMKNIYGLNYTGAAALYQNYQDIRKTFNGDREAEEKYFSGDNWKEVLEGFKDNPAYNNSTESTMLMYVEDIKKYTYEIGQWHLDKKMPEIADALKEAWEEARNKGTTTDPGPGNHANPYPPPSNPNPYPPPPKEEPKTPERERTEETLDDLKNVATAPPVPGAPTGDIIRTAQNQAIEAQVLEAKAQAEVIRKNNNATKNLFSEWFGGERGYMNAINNTVNAAAKSGKLEEFNAAKEFADIISRYGASDAAGKTYDNDNTFNSLAEFSGDMLGMLNALRSLVERIDGVKVNVTSE
jgi:hypothetical protein